MLKMCSRCMHVHARTFMHFSMSKRCHVVLGQCFDDVKAMSRRCHAVHVDMLDQLDQWRAAHSPSKCARCAKNQTHAVFIGMCIVTSRLHYTMSWRASPRSCHAWRLPTGPFDHWLCQPKHRCRALKAAPHTAHEARCTRDLLSCSSAGDAYDPGGRQ